MAEVRVDKWLWAVRLYKTRSLAAEACKKGKVTCNGQTLKPSHVVKVGEIYQVKRSPIVCSYKVLALAHNRMGAKLVPDFMLDVTTPDQLELLELVTKSVLIFIMISPLSFYADYRRKQFLASRDIRPSSSLSFCSQGRQLASCCGIAQMVRCSRLLRLSYLEAKLHSVFPDRSCMAP